MVPPKVAAKAHSSTPSSSTPRFIAWAGLILAVLSFALGAGIYIHDRPERPADGVFKSLQMFHLHFHPLKPKVPQTGTAPAPPTPMHEHAMDHGEDGEDGDVPLLLEIARFGAATVALGLLPAVLVLALFRADISRRWVRYFWRNHVIVCGHCTRTLSLIKDLRRQRLKRRVVFIGRCPASQSELPHGVLHLEGDAPTGRLLHFAAVHDAMRAFHANVHPLEFAND